MPRPSLYPNSLFFPHFLVPNRVSILIKVCLQFSIPSYFPFFSIYCRLSTRTFPSERKLTFTPSFYPDCPRFPLLAQRVHVWAPTLLGFLPSTSSISPPSGTAYPLRRRCNSGEIETSRFFSPFSKPIQWFLVNGYLYPAGFL